MKFQNPSYVKKRNSCSRSNHNTLIPNVELIPITTKQYSINIIIISLRRDFTSPRLSQKPACIGHTGGRYPTIPRYEVRNSEATRIRCIDHMIPGPTDPVTCVRARARIVVLSIIQSAQSNVSGPCKPTRRVDQAIDEGLHIDRPRILLPWPSKV